MCIKILSASVSVPKGTDAMVFQFHPSINILWGQNSENIVLALAGITRFVSGEDGWNIVDGRRLPDGFDSASDLLLKSLYETLAKEDDRPLFICSFLERLNDAVDLQPILEALLATGRQVFIAVPHYYISNTREETYHDTLIHAL